MSVHSQMMSEQTVFDKEVSRLVLEQSHLPTRYVLELRTISTRVLGYTL